MTVPVTSTWLPNSNLAVEYIIGMRVNLDYNESFEMFELREQRISAAISARRDKGLPFEIGIDWFPPGWPEFRGTLWMKCFYRSSTSGRWKINYHNKHFVKVPYSGKTLLSSFSITINYTIFLFCARCPSI